MTPHIDYLSEKKLVGIRLSMSLLNNRTGELWAGFMPRRNIIINKLSSDFILMQIYPNDYFTDFLPENILRNGQRLKF